MSHGHVATSMWWSSGEDTFDQYMC